MGNLYHRKLHQRLVVHHVIGEGNHIIVHTLQKHSYN